MWYSLGPAEGCKQGLRWHAGLPLSLSGVKRIMYNMEWAMPNIVSASGMSTLFASARRHQGAVLECRGCR